MATENIRAWQQEIRDAKKMLHAAMVQGLPLGCTVAYWHGENEIHVTVIEHSRHDASLKVRGISGKEYWLDLSRLSHKMEGREPTVELVGLCGK